MFYTHTYLLGDFGVERFETFSKFQSRAGAFGVLGFFGVSGFLVARSFALHDSAERFVKSRLLRIVPGLYFALLVTAFVLAPLISRCNAESGGWSAAAAGHFFTDNLLIRLRAWNVGAVLRGLPYDGSINGSLWTLFPEVCCYGFVLVAGLLGLLRSGPANMVLMTAIALAFSAAVTLAPAAIPAAPTLLSLSQCGPNVRAFMVGATLFCLRDHLEGGVRPALFWWGVVLVVLHFGGWGLVGPLVLPLALIHTAFAGTVNLRCDLSYGFYLFHFPVLQLATALGWNHRGLFRYAVGALLLTLILATVSWFAVERPLLTLRRR